MPPLSQPREDAPTKPTALVTNVLREEELEVEVAVELTPGRSLPAYAEAPAANARTDTTFFIIELCYTIVAILIMVRFDDSSVINSNIPYHVIACSDGMVRTRKGSHHTSKQPSPAASHRQPARRESPNHLHIQSPYRPPVGKEHKSNF